MADTHISLVVQATPGLRRCGRTMMLLGVMGNAIGNFSTAHAETNAQPAPALSGAAMATGVRR